MVKCCHGETGRDSGFVYIGTHINRPDRGPPRAMYTPGVRMTLTDTWLKANDGKERAALAERCDREGLGVRITPKGKITFQMRYRYQGKPRRLDLRKFLGKDFPPQSLPTIEEAIALVERHRASLDKETAEDERTTAIANLRKAHQTRRDALAQERQRLEAQQGERVAALTAQQRGARDALRHRHLERRKLFAHERRENRLTRSPVSAW